MYKLGIEITDVLSDASLKKEKDESNSELISVVYKVHQDRTLDFHFIDEPIHNKSHAEVKAWLQRMGIAKPKVTLYKSKLDAAEALGIDHYISNNLDLCNNLYFKGIKTSYYYPGYDFNLYFDKSFQDIENRMHSM